MYFKEWWFRSFSLCTFADLYTCSLWGFFSVSNGTWQSLVKWKNLVTFDLPTKATIKVRKICSKSATSMMVSSTWFPLCPFSIQSSYFCSSNPLLHVHLPNSFEVLPSNEASLVHRVPSLISTSFERLFIFNYIGMRKALCYWYRTGW